MTKKIAIQLFGHLRSFRKTFENFHHNVIIPIQKEGYEIDIFIHTWDETDTSSKSWHNVEGDDRGRSITEDDRLFIEEYYKPKKLLIEPQLKIEEDFIITERLLELPRQYSTIINSSYTKFKVNELRQKEEKENSIEYDYVLMTRPDVSFENEFSIQSFLDTYNQYKVEVPKNGVFCASVPFRRGNIEPDIFLCSIDLIFFAKPQVMDTINYFYQDIASGEISKKYIIENSYSLEILWLQYWKEKKIELVKLKYFQFEDYELIRNIEEYYPKPKLKLIIENIAPPVEKKNQKLRKIRRELLKLLPYFLVKKEIERLDNKIKGSHD